MSNNNPSAHLANETLWRIIYIHTPIWRLLVILLVYISGQMIMLPWLPQLMTNDFAHRRAGEPIHCEDFDPKESPDSCINAHSDVVLWSTWSGLVQNTIFSIILVPALGAWSDINGRKPFLLLCMACPIVPYIIVILNLYTGLPLYWLYIIQSLTGSISSIAPSLAYIADVTPPQHRAACFGLIMASFSLAILIGPPIGALFLPTTAPFVTIGVIVLCMFGTAIFLPESVSESIGDRAKQHQEQQHSQHKDTPFSSLSATFGAISILRRSPLFMRLSIVLMLSAVVSEGIQDILIQYLQLKLGFGVKDVSHIFMIFGAGALIIQGLLLQSMLSTFGECRLLVIGLVASALQQFFLALCLSKWQALAAVSLGCLGSVTFPTISSIKANNSDQHEQGSVQGALYGARSLASGVGPLVFAWLFAGFTRTDSPLPFVPGIPFFLGSVLMGMTAVLAWRLPVNAGGSAGTLFMERHGEDSGGSDSGGGGRTNDDAVELEYEEAKSLLLSPPTP